MQLRYLEPVNLYKKSRVKQSNGAYKEEYELIDSYNVAIQELNDEVSVSMYGADLSQILRIKSNDGLEKFLKPKMIDESDNVSKYSIVYQNIEYKIVSVRSNWLDVKMFTRFENDAV